MTKQTAVRSSRQLREALARAEPRSIARTREAWSKGIGLASEALARESRGGTLTEAVKWIAKKRNVSQRHIWKYVPPARAREAQILENLQALPGPRRRQPKQGQRIRSAHFFLIAFLFDGPVPATEVLEDAKAAGISSRTLRRAAKSLSHDGTKSAASIIVYKLGGRNGRWFWDLSDEAKKFFGSKVAKSTGVRPSRKS
jgi:hypothetical protein